MEDNLTWEEVEDKVVPYIEECLNKQVSKFEERKWWKRKSDVKNLDSDVVIDRFVELEYDKPSLGSIGFIIGYKIERDGKEGFVVKHYVFSNDRVVDLVNDPKCWNDDYYVDNVDVLLDRIDDTGVSVKNIVNWEKKLENK